MKIVKMLGIAVAALALSAPSFAFKVTAKPLSVTRVTLTSGETAQALQAASVVLASNALRCPPGTYCPSISRPAAQAVAMSSGTARRPYLKAADCPSGSLRRPYLKVADCPAGSLRRPYLKAADCPAGSLPRPYLKAAIA